MRQTEMVLPTTPIVQFFQSGHISEFLGELDDNRRHFFGVFPEPLVGLGSFAGFDLISDLLEEFGEPG